MAGPKEFSIRRPAVAGAFYPADPEQCRQFAESLVPPGPGAASSPRGGLGAIVPHAGWICSGRIAGESLAALAGGPPPELVVIFGAVHTPIPLLRAALGPHEAWNVPGATFEVAAGDAAALCEDEGLFVVDERFHRREHAVEVELPLIGRLWPAAKILPVEVPAVENAPEVGCRLARQVLGRGRVVFLASSDLTHYGPAYGFTPAGVGPQALAWAKENDRRVLRVVCELAAERVVPEARGHLNACGAGAIAAMLSACRESGATSARVLRHQNSYETLAGLIAQDPTDAVGYAAVVVE